MLGGQTRPRAVPYNAVGIILSVRHLSGRPNPGRPSGSIPKLYVFNMGMSRFVESWRSASMVGSWGQMSMLPDRNHGFSCPFTESTCNKLGKNLSVWTRKRRLASRYFRSDHEHSRFDMCPNVRNCYLSFLPLI